MLALGIDPGTATTGYGIIEYNRGNYKVHNYGIIVTPSSMAMPQRLCEIQAGINTLIAEFKPEFMAIEQVFFHKNTKTVITVAQSRGVAIVTAAGAGIKVAEYTPLQVKQAVVGYGNADKKQVQLMVQKILSLKQMPAPDDAADALAIAICHIHSHRLQNIYQEEKRL